MKPAYLILAALSLTACGPASDPVFGSSYDACILKNHGDGSDVATDACARHYTRKATPIETENLSLSSVAEVKHYAESGEDDVVVRVDNKSHDLIITEVALDARFYDHPSPWRSSDGYKPRYLTKAIKQAPGTADDYTFYFPDNKAPGPFADIKVEATEVISHTGATAQSDKLPPIYLPPAPAAPKR